jgi:hypothetical protein
MRRISIRPLVFALVCATLAVAAACGGSDFPDNPDVSVAGTYNLHTVNNQSLPFTMPDGSNLASYRIVALDDGTWTSVAVYGKSVNGQTETDSVSDHGTWTLTGTTFTLNSAASNSVVFTGIFNTHVLTLTGQDGRSYSFIS